jgi:hypothetical protein
MGADLSRLGIDYGTRRRRARAGFASLAARVPVVEHAGEQGSTEDIVLARALARIRTSWGCGTSRHGVRPSEVNVVDGTKLTTRSRTNRLVANRLLRIRKVAAYVAEKLEAPQPAARHSTESRQQQSVPGSPTSTMHSRSSSRSHKSLEGDLEIVCNSVVVPPLATLASVQRFVAKTSSDLHLFYRRKSAGPFS